MNASILLWFIIVPALCSLPVFFWGKRIKFVSEAFALLATVLNLAIAVMTFKKELILNHDWFSLGGLQVPFYLKLTRFNGFFLIAGACFAFLICLYSISYLKGKNQASLFYAFFLINITLSNGALLANNLIIMLFFWEGLLVTLFAMIMCGGKESFRTAIKAFIIVGVADLCMMLGIALTGFQTQAFNMDAIQGVSLGGLSTIAFGLLLIGAISKAGCMPFHSWIPDAAVDAPLPFMAYLPGAMEKIVGIYFVARLCLDLFKLNPGSRTSYVIMTIGALTIFLAVMMALVQKNYKRLLSYHAISQVGYMILGIGTGLTVGIIGGLFHMINNAIYKSALFLTGGAVELQAGSADLRELGGLRKKMPVTFICFLITAAAISGFPLLNGFYSKELVFDSAWEAGKIFYAIAVIGAFFTAASFLKLGHAVYIDQPRGKTDQVKEAPLPMLIPMIILAAICILFGVFNALPINQLIIPGLPADRLEAGHHFGAILPQNWLLAGISIFVLLLAYLNHRYGVKKTRSGLTAVDHIHHAPVLQGIYERAEKRYFDPYDIGLKIVNLFSRVAWAIDRGIDWLYNGLTVGVTLGLSKIIRLAHTGNHALYLLWSLAGLAVFLIYMITKYYHF